VNQVRLVREDIERLGEKLDRLAEDLTADEKLALSAVFHVAAQIAPEDAEAPLSKSLKRAVAVGGIGPVRLGAQTMVTM
jgi:hypothetical protein